jgi:hypothetical protein
MPPPAGHDQLVSMKRVVALAAMLVAAGLGTTSEAAAAQSSCTWQMRVLPVPAGVSQNEVTATDHAGGYSGRGYFSDGWHVVYWKNGQVIDYGRTGYGNDRVVGQNRGGTIAALSSAGLWQERAISFRIRNGQREMLPALPGAENTSRALGIAENDDVYGNNVVWQGDRYVSVAVRWPADRPNVVERVGLPDGMRIVDVDHDATLLVGPENVYPWPHLWRNGQLTRLPEPPNTQHGYGRAITDGLVAGSLRVGSASNRPAYWDRAGQPHLLSQSAVAIQINRNGLLVAEQSATPHQIWRFGSLEGQITNATAINTIGDDDTIGGTTLGSSSHVATVWRCQ